MKKLRDNLTPLCPPSSARSLASNVILRSLPEADYRRIWGGAYASQIALATPQTLRFAQGDMEHAFWGKAPARRWGKHMNNWGHIPQTSCQRSPEVRDSLASSLLLNGIVGCLLALSLIFSVISCQPQAPADADTFWVMRVIDGDTIIVEGNVRVRYIGMNAPEMDESFGEMAKETNQTLVQGKRVKLEKDVSNTDRYGRWLRYVYADGLMINGEIVRLGLARAHPYPPDTKYQNYLSRLEEDARKAGRGLWAR